MNQNLYERLGGQSGVDTAVGIFYKKILADDRINAFFDNTNMEEQQNKQKAFLTIAFGGPNNYKGKNMQDGHQHLNGLNDSHVDAFIEHLGSTLKELGANDEDIREAASIANSTRDDILNR